MNGKGILTLSSKFNPSVTKQILADRLEIYTCIDSKKTLVDALLDTPFEYTVYLAEHCLVLHSILPFFKILEKYEMIVTHDFTYNHEDDSTELPASYPFYNYDVFGIVKNKHTRAFLESWKQKKQSGQDSPVVFRQLCWESDLKIYVLPPEWNIFQKKYLYLWNEQEVQPAVLSISNPQHLYKKIKGSVKIIYKLRYQWRKLKELFWQFKQF